MSVFVCPISIRAAIRRTAPLAGLIAGLLGWSSLHPAIGQAQPSAPGAVSVVQTAAAQHQRLAPLPGLQFTPVTPPSGTPLITVGDTTTYQAVTGFGAAMTDSSAWLIERKLSASSRSSLMNEFFGANGLRLDLLRVPIGASDFTATGVPYSYDDMPAGSTDVHLTHFSIAHDRSYILPALSEARSLNSKLEFLGTPWSPPAWMKRNDSLGNVANRGTLRAIAYGPWAAYIVKFIQAYARAGIPIGAITPQNEPGNPTSYPGMNLSAGAESNWITQDLVPALTKAHLQAKVYGEDSGWSSASTAFAQATVASAAAKDLAGIAWHCYYGSPNVMSSLHQSQPALGQIVDECSPGISAIPISEVVIGSLRNWASAVALWNLALDPKGGPVQAPNSGCPRCFGLATINEAGGAVSLNLPFYQLGQASEFVQPGAVRVASNNFVTYNYSRPGQNFVSAGIDDVAVVNPDGSRVMVAYNNSTSPIKFAVAWRGQYFEYSLPAAATVTFEWNRP